MWIVGAVNAFNLIDGLDGLASGLAFIAVLGMAGALVFSGNAHAVYFHLAFAGGLLGFLRRFSVFLRLSHDQLLPFSYPPPIQATRTHPVPPAKFCPGSLSFPENIRVSKLQSLWYFYIPEVNKDS